MESQLHWPRDGAGHAQGHAQGHEPRDAGRVTASEFTFLAFGLVLGVVSGAALIEFVRARPPAPRDVRVTFAHDAIPRRATTLSDDAFTAMAAEPARGGPADRRWMAPSVPSGAFDRRTTVRFSSPVPGAIPIGAVPATPVPGSTVGPTIALAGATQVRAVGSSGELIGIPISSGTDPVLTAIRAATVAAVADSTADVTMGAATPIGAAAEADPATGDPTAPIGIGASTAVALAERPASTAKATPGATERCAEERRLADERCELATRARTQADAAEDALRHAQRTYDGHEAAALAARSTADPRAVHAAKEAAQGGFRAAVAAATNPEELEAAARDWLTEINRINNEARDATVTATREHEAAAAIVATLDRLGLEADAARIGAANADAACLAARTAVAECDERASEDPSTFLIPPATTSFGFPGLDEDETLGLALEAGGAPRIFKLVRGDRAAMTTLVAKLAGDDPDARRRWQLMLTGLVEAIVADAIEASALEFPDDHPFWGPFTKTQNRDISHALASLGYRFDGLGGWTDNRFPSQRDMSLALGYAGLDPMRVRKWPNEEATASMYRDVTVAADEYLAGVAGDLTLGEMVTMLGRRADGLAELWNNWGKVRPLLLEEA